MRGCCSFVAVVSVLLLLLLRCCGHCFVVVVYFLFVLSRRFCCCCFLRFFLGFSVFPISFYHCLYLFTLLSYTRKKFVCVGSEWGGGGGEGGKGS